MKRWEYTWDVVPVIVDSFRHGERSAMQLKVTVIFPSGETIEQTQLLEAKRCLWWTETEAETVTRTQVELMRRIHRMRSRARRLLRLKAFLNRENPQK